MPLTLKLHTQPEVPLEAELISPDGLAGKSNDEIARLPLLHGNRPAALGEFFRLSGSGAEELRVEGDLTQVKLLGYAMSAGKMVIAGSAGMHTGAAMRGGELVVEGDVGDWAGAEMQGGLLLIRGNAGHMLGSGYRGSRIGMTGGEIVVLGSAGSEVGSTMRRGLIAVGGTSGDFSGVNLLAGTIIVLGDLGWRAGAGMKRGTIVTMGEARILPTFSYACRYQPTFLRLYLRRLQILGMPISEDQLSGSYRRWSGDMVELGRGELLVFDS